MPIKVFKLSKKFFDKWFLCGFAEFCRELHFHNPRQNAKLLLESAAMHCLSSSGILHAK